jgi:hypothetical protein
MAKPFLKGISPHSLTVKSNGPSPGNNHGYATPPINAEVIDLAIEKEVLLPIT